MPQVTGTTTEDNKSVFTKFTGSATTTSQNFTFSEEQNGMTFRNKGSSAMTLTVDGVTHNIPPNATIEIDDHEFSSFDVKSAEGTQTFEIRSFVAKTAIRNVNALLADTTTKVDNLGVVSAEIFPRLNGEADDTARLQRAIDDPNVRNIVLKRGTTYTFTSLNLKNDVRIYGEDRSSSKLKHIGTGIAIKNPNTTAIGRVMIDHLTLELNVNTTIGIEFARVFNSQINFIDIIGGESTGVGISFDDGTVYAAYYNSCYDVAISGYFNGAKTLGTGFKFANSANSNRLVSCRTNYVKTAVDIATDYCNHIVIFGCAFEKFDTGVRINGDICQVIATRFENAGGSATGVGIEITATSGTNTVIGNTISNVLTPLLNNNPTGNNHIFDYGTFSVKYLSHETGGGWKTNQDMRNYAFQNAGFVSLTKRTSAPASPAQGTVAYADGTTWNPGSGEGVYVYKSTGWVLLG